MWFKIIRLAEVEFTTREYDFLKVADRLGIISAQVVFVLRGNFKFRI